MISFMMRCCQLIMLLALAINHAQADPLTLTSTAFAKGQPIPADFAYHGKNISPPLQIAGVPRATKSLVIIFDDPDSPTGLRTHWLVWNIPTATTLLASDKLPAEALQGENASGHNQYDGPAPPLGSHRYFFHLIALDTLLDLPSGSRRPALEKAMAGHILAQAETYGTYEIP